MKRTLFLASGCALVALALGAILFSSNNTQADGPGDATPGEAQGVAESSVQLPIGQVVLFSSGVGYFQREGEVEGNARVDLSFPVQDINDLIKSMVLRDLDGGHVAAVSYDSNSPVERTLQSFAISLNGNPSFGAILNQARGEKVEVVLLQANATQPGTMTGTLIGVEEKAELVKDWTVRVEFLNMWCADGMRSFKLNEVQRVRFLNPVMESEIRQALETLALSHDTQKKAVSMHFAGEGKRRVRVGYVIENPIWKTSYRLVLDKDKDTRPYLQGWAVVENPSDEDWKDVRMALISGRPISFQMDLYSQLFVPRPVVVPELFASLNPVAYSGGMLPGRTRASVEFPPPPGTNFGTGEAVPLVPGGDVQITPLKELGGVVVGATNSADAKEVLAIVDQLKQRMHLSDSVTSVASASKLGDYFQYVIDRPVSLPRQKSALLPIVGKDVDGTRLSIYNEGMQAKFPLLGMRLKNTSGLHLMQGPITVFEGSVYAGDARILDLQPGEERLISYAVDLGTEVNPVPHSDNGKLTSVKIVKGLVYTTTKVRESKDYTITNRNDAERLVLVEHPVRNEFKLVDTDKPTETASDVYRFEVKIPAGKTETKTVTEERIISESIGFSNLDDQRIQFFLNQTVVSDKVKGALKQAQSLRWEAAKTQREIQELQRQLTTITQDQQRLRENLKAMPSTANAYKRYLEKFDEQETQIEKYQEDIKRLQGVEHTQKKNFEDFLAQLTVE